MNLAHRDLEVFRVQLVHQGNQEKGVVTELMVHEECQERQGLRVTEVLMAFLVFLERRDIEESMARQVLQDLQERMVQEVKTARLDKEAWLERVVLEVCLDLEGLQVLQGSVVFLDLMGKLVPKETWVHKESQGLLGNRVCLVHMVLLVLKVRLGLLVKKDLRGNKAWLASLVLTALRVTQAKRVLQARKEQLVILVQWDPLVTLGLVV